MEEFQCFQMDREPLPNYLRRFVQKKAQTPNFSEKAAIEKCITGLLPSQQASHLSREPPKMLAELYTEVEKYARSDADHRRRVEQRKQIRQQQGWPQGNQNSARHNSQYIFLVEPSQKAAPHHDTEPYMTPPPLKHSIHSQAITAMTTIEEADPPAA